MDQRESPFEATAVASSLRVSVSGSSLSLSFVFLSFTSPFQDNYFGILISCCMLTARVSVCGSVGVKRVAEGSSAVENLGFRAVELGVESSGLNSSSLPELS